MCMTTTTNETKVRLYKARAGWYETTPEPEAGTYVTYSTHSGYYKQTLWAILRYEVSPVDGGLDLVSIGHHEPTLAYARSVIAELLAEEAND